MRNLLSLVVVAICFYNINAQSSNPEIVSTSGESFQGSSIQLDWTLGELAITTIQNSSQQITQGFHQANYTITSVEDFQQEFGVVNVYPNPTSDRIELELRLQQIREVQIQLLDINGKLIWTKHSFGNLIVQSTEMGSLPNGNYFLHLLIDKEFHRTFKILKQ